jgi:hypothetical protein
MNIVALEVVGIHTFPVIRCTNMAALLISEVGDKRFVCIVCLLMTATESHC